MSRDMTKPTKWVCTQRRFRSAWASAQSDQFPHEESLALSYPLSAQQRFWSDWADAQADQSLRWAHSHFVGFDMLLLISSKGIKLNNRHCTTLHSLSCANCHKNENNSLPFFLHLSILIHCLPICTRTHENHSILKKQRTRLTGAQLPMAPKF